MAKKKFSTLPQDNKLVDILTVVGEVILLDLLCIVCCLPIVTIASSLSSFYYSIIKSVRKGVGDPIQEFFSSMKRTLAKGCIISILIIIWCGLLFLSYFSMIDNNQFSKVWLMIDCILILFTVFVLAYIFAVFSRFDVSIAKIISLSFVMSVRYFYFTIILIVFAAALALAQFYLLPVVCISFTPAIYVFVSTFMIEIALQKYTPPPEDGNERWYDIKSSNKEGVQSDCES